MASDPIAALLEVVRCFEEIGLTYAIGGSVASSVHGEPRASADADVVVELAEHHLPDLVAGLEAAFYVSDDAAREAIRRAGSFNVIHLDSAYKVDIFVAGPDMLDREQLRRRELVVIAADPDARAFVTAAENVVLRKLDWFRKGGGVSDLQWRDVLGVLKVQGPSLDVTYLRDIARQVGLDALLARAMSEAGLAPD